MSMDICTKILGVVPKDEKYEKMLQVFDACKAADINYPKEVIDFFQLDEFLDDYIPPHDGIELDISEYENVLKKKGSEEYEEGAVYDIDITKLPQSIKKIRVKVYWC